MFYTGFSFDSKSAVPNSYFGAGTPSFQENLTKLCSGTPTLLKKSPWDSCFENPSENPAIGLCQFRLLQSVPGTSAHRDELYHQGVTGNGPKIVHRQPQSR